MLDRRNFFKSLVQYIAIAGLSGGVVDKLRAAGQLQILCPGFYDSRYLTDYFRSVYGVVLDIKNYYNNDELAKEIIQKNVKYDCIIASGSELAPYIKRNYINPINPKYLKNFDNIEKNYKNNYDTALKFSLPLFYYNIILGYNEKKLSKQTSWGTIFTKPTTKSDGTTARIAWLNDGNIMFRLALNYMNANFNDPTSDEILNAQKFLANCKKNISNIVNFNSFQQIIDNNADITVSFAHDIISAKKSFNYLGISLPEEGIIRDDYAVLIPKTSDNLSAAHAFIDLMLSPAIAKNTSETLNLGTYNREASFILDNAHLNNADIYPKKIKIIQAKNFSESTAIEIANAWQEIYG